MTEEDHRQRRVEWELKADIAGLKTEIVGLEARLIRNLAMQTAGIVAILVAFAIVALLVAIMVN